MNKKNTVFVGISLIYVQDIFGVVEVSTSLAGLCRVIGVEYERTRKRWRRKGKDDSVDVWDNEITVRWRIFEKEVDMIWNRGNDEFGKKIKATWGGFRGYRGDDGRLVDQKPVLEKKRTLAEDTTVSRGISDEGEYEYD